MNIQFVCNGILYDSRGGVNVNPAYFFLRAYYLLHGLNPNVNWYENEWFMFDTLEVQAERIIAKKPDVLACSVYVWNYDFQYRLMRKVKEALPNCIVVAGGPQLAAHKHPDFFDEHPYMDYVCYGDGEEAFRLLIDKVSGYLPEDTVLYNIVENLHPGYKLNPFKILSDKKYLSTSSVMLQTEEIKNSIEHIISRGVKKENIEFALEFARGCMYACSFCDWSQNLTKKVKRRTHDWKPEFDFFHEIDIAIRETDANFGQFKEDLEIFNYGLSLYDPDRNFRFHVHNTPKLLKEVTYYIMMEQIKRFLKWFVISLQDIHDDVLANVDRPSISWEEHIDLIKRINAELPEDKKRSVAAQLILGLPGQTPERIAHMIAELYKLDVGRYSADNWVYLENSPAANKNYEEKFDIEWNNVWFIQNPNVDTLKIENLEKLFEELSQNKADPNYWFRVKILTKNNSMDFTDIMQSTRFIRQFTRLTRKLKIKAPDTLVDKMKQDILKQARSDVERTLEIQKPYAEKYGFYIYGLVEENSVSIF